MLQLRLHEQARVAGQQLGDVEGRRVRLPRPERVVHVAVRQARQLDHEPLHLLALVLLALRAPMCLSITKLTIPGKEKNNS